MVQLISDGGSMTVGRRTANWTWGAFEVTLPEGETQAEPEDDRLVDGYLYRPDDRESGRFDLTFVRADIRLDMNATKSDMESTLDSASRRTTGDAYYTREISGIGLGRTIPGKDFRTHDRVDVLIWGKVMSLIVAAITATSEPGNPTAWAVQVGDQPLTDAEALRKRNSDLDTQIATEKRQRLNETGQVRQTAETAAGTAATAKTTAEKAVLTTQQLVDREQSVSIALQENNSLWTQWRAHRTYPVTPEAPISNEWLTAAIDGGTLTIQLAGERWIGRIQVLATSSSGFPTLRNYLISAGGGRVQTIVAADSYVWQSAIIFIQPFFGVVAREWALMAKGNGWQQSRSWDFPEDPSPQIDFYQHPDGIQVAFPCDVLADSTCQWWNPDSGEGEWVEVAVGGILPTPYWIRPRPPGEEEIDAFVKFKELIV